MNGTWKFFSIEVNALVGGDCDAFIAFQTLDPTATEQLVGEWAWDKSHGLSVRLDEENGDDVTVTELSKDEFRALTLGQITGHVIDNRRYPKPAVSAA